MPAPVIPEEDEGIMVSFGDSPDGAGLGDGGVIKTDIDNVQPAPALSVPKPAVASRPQELLTQDNENTIAIATQKKKEREKQRELQIVTEQ